MGGFRADRAFRVPPFADALIGSWSFVGSLEASARAELLARVEQLLAEDGIDSVELSWRCDLYLTRRH
jgi:hypothetical protein